MKMDSRFASKAQSVDETPEPFREQLRKQLRADEEVSLLVCAPAYHFSKDKFPATVLALTDQRWLIVEEVQSGVTKVSGAAFDETLLIEFTEILLFGELKIHFALDGIPRSSAARFNTVTDGYYREAAQLLLDHIEERSPLASGEASSYTAGLLSALPFKFKNDVLQYVPQGRQILFTTHWPTLIGGFRRELAPAAVLALTERELMLITEDKPRRWFESKKTPKYATIATYLPLARLAQHRFGRHPKFCLLELETHVRHGGEVFEIMFPLENEAKVGELMERAAEVRGTTLQVRDNPIALPACERSPCP
jgi:hypothetical protein